MVGSILGSINKLLGVSYSECPTPYSWAAGCPTLNVLLDISVTCLLHIDTTYNTRLHTKTLFQLLQLKMQMGFYVLF